jgi:multidrug efflux pump subunit AcrA (membrane-fusion protein)
MWMKIPGRNNLAPLQAGALVLILVVLAAGAGLTAEKSGSEPTAPPAIGPPAESETIITGKVFCSLKRRVDLHFKGVITSLKARSGQKVEAGDILATYQLSPDALLAIRQRLSPSQISETEVKLAEMEKDLLQAQNRQRELTQLAARHLASAQSLNQANREVQLLMQERAATQARLQNDRRIAQQDLTVLSMDLGKSIMTGQIPKEAVLKAPISGYVVRVNLDLEEGAELDPTPGVFLVGVMDPMVVQAQAFEIEALQIHVGDSAEVTLESLPGRKFEARVRRISWSSLTPGLDQPSYYEVELTVPNPDLTLKEGLKAHITFRKSAKQGSS